MPSDTVITMEWVPIAWGSEVPERMDEPLASSVRFSPDGRELEEKAKALPSGSEAKKRYWYKEPTEIVAGGFPELKVGAVFRLVDGPGVGFPGETSQLSGWLDQLSFAFLMSEEPFPSAPVGHGDESE